MHEVRRRTKSSFDGSVWLSESLLRLSLRDELVRGSERVTVTSSALVGVTRMRDVLREAITQRGSLL